MKRIMIMLLAALIVLTGCDLIMSEGTLFGTLEEENAAGIANGFSGGNGTAESPYLISNADQFRIIGTEDFQNELLKGENDDLYFRLTADIDLSDQEGYVAEVFSGTLDGDGHTIYGSNNMPYIFHYFFEDTTFRNFTVEFADENISLLYMGPSFLALEAFDDGVAVSTYGPGYLYDQKTLTLSLDNIDYAAAAGTYYTLGDNNFSFYMPNSVCAFYAYYDSDFYDAWSFKIYPGKESVTPIVYEINMAGCDVTGNYTGGFGNSGAAIFLGGQLCDAHVTMTDCSFNGVLEGYNVGLVFANKANCFPDNNNPSNDDLHFTAQDVTGSEIKSYSGKGSLAFSNFDWTFDGVTGTFTEVVGSQVMYITGSLGTEVGFPTELPAGAEYIDVKFSLPSVYWYHSESDKTPYGPTNSNNKTIRVNDFSELDNIYYARPISRLEAEESGKFGSINWQTAEEFAEGERFVFAEADGNWFLIIDYGDNVGRYTTDGTVHSDLTDYGYLKSIIVLARDSANKIASVSNLLELK